MLDSISGHDGEPAIDGGGPVREFYTILIRELLSPSLTVRLFEGKDPSFIPIHNTDALRSNLFKVAWFWFASIP
jgi:hypothetical protein